MMSSLSSKETTNYHPLSPSDLESSHLERNNDSKSHHQTAILIIQIVVTFAVSFGLGLFIGRRSFPNRRDGLLLPPGTVQQVWQHNLTFSQKPTPESEAAWASIVPVGRGFIHHPEIAPFISNIAVFHKLHCLHAILVAYYIATDDLQAANGSAASDNFLKETGTRIAIEHIRHCFDYLRRSLMCAADTNLEVLNRETHLTNGWGQKRQCRDYDEVFTWAERWRNSSDTGIVT